MIVQLYYKFYHSEQFESECNDCSINHLTIKQLNNPEKKLLKEFINQILIDEIVWGRNKDSAKNNDLVTIQKIFNFQSFETNNLRHYHLVPEDKRDDTCDYIQSNNDKSLNTCDIIVHYKLVNDFVIIYSVSKHGQWNDLLKLTNNNNLIYFTCPICSKVSLTEGENCSCNSNHTHINIMLNYNDTPVINIQQQTETITVQNKKEGITTEISETEIVNLSQNISIKNISDLNNII